MKAKKWVQKQNKKAEKEFTNEVALDAKKTEERKGRKIQLV